MFSGAETRRGGQRGSKTETEMATKILLRDVRRALMKRPPRGAENLFERAGGSHENVFGDAVLPELVDTHSTLLAQRHATEVDAEIPVLRSHIASSTLTPADFQRVKPDVSLRYVIRGRYASNLVATEDYFLVFASVGDLQEYSRACAVSEAKLDGSRINAKPVKTLDFAGYLRFLYPQLLADLADLPALVDIVQQGASKKKGHLEVLQQLLQGRRDLLERSPLATDTVLERAQALLSVQTPPDRQELVQRSCCVILRNVPANIATSKITAFFWDLAWFADGTRTVRPVFFDKRTHFNTYVLAFADEASAKLCVRRADGHHLFYNPVLPVVSAELL